MVQNIDRLELPDREVSSFIQRQAEAFDSYASKDEIENPVEAFYRWCDSKGFSEEQRVQILATSEVLGPGHSP